MEFYLMLIASSLMVSVDFVFNKLYQRRCGATLQSGLFFNLLIGLFSAAIFFCVGGFRIELTPFSVIAALIMTATAITYVIIGFFILSKGKMAYYSFFRMSGSMLIPYIWGVLALGEELTPLRTVGVALILLSAVLLYADSFGMRVRYVWMLLAVFLLAGTVSVISKMHAISPSAVSPIGYVVLTSLAKPLLCAPILLVLHKKGKERRQAWDARGRVTVLFLIFLSALITGLAYILQLYSAARLPASVVYPIVTGGSIVFTMIAGWVFFHERPRRRMLLAAGMAFFGTCLFL